MERIIRPRTNPTIAATPDTKYDFTGWSGRSLQFRFCQHYSLDDRGTVIDRKLFFKSYTLSLTAGSGGTVSGAGSFAHGTSPTIVATPDTGYDFTGWSGTGVSNSSSASTTVSMTEARSLTANFLSSPIPFSHRRFRGTVSGAGSFDHGTNPTIAATPDTGYDFTGWSGTGVSNSSSASTTVSMTEARSLTANFSLKSYTLSLTAGSGEPFLGLEITTMDNMQLYKQLHSQIVFNSWLQSGVSKDTNPSTTILMNEDKIDCLFYSSTREHFLPWLILQPYFSRNNNWGRKLLAKCACFSYSHPECRLSIHWVDRFGCRKSRCQFNYHQYEPRSKPDCSVFH